MALNGRFGFTRGTSHDFPPPNPSLQPSWNTFRENPDRSEYPIQGTTPDNVWFWLFGIPNLPAGWFAGMMEAKQRTPTTDDFRSIMDAETVQDMLDNRLFRVLLVAALANLGSVLGTIIGVIVIVNVTGIDPTDTLQNIFNNISDLFRFPQ